jgi:type I restriction-modification system DNA methylase subunit
MPTDDLELISMADIARLAGQSRATVGNWKARNPDFPVERGRGTRGPLYDRAEVLSWLQSTDRIKVPATDVPTAWHLMEQMRGSVSVDEALHVLFALLAVRARSSSDEWREIQASPPGMLNSLLRRHLMPLVDLRTDLMPSDSIPSKVLARAVETISNAGLPAGGIADSLIEQFANARIRTAHTFVYPPSVRQLVIAIAKPSGPIYDPAAGFGQLLIDAVRASNPHRYDIFGQVRDREAYAIALLNLIIHGIEAEIAAGDALRRDVFRELRAHSVIAIPPLGSKLPSADELTGDPRWAWGEPGPNDADAAWIQHCLFHLANDGRAVLVLPNHILFASGRTGRIRQRIVTAGLLDAVVSLPPGLFYSTSIAVSLLVFVKGRPDVKGDPAPTLMIEARSSTLDRAGSASPLPAELIVEVAGLYHQWTSGTLPNSGLAAVAHFDDLAANDFVIDPARYVAVPTVASDVDAVTTERNALVDQLDTLTHASRDADDRLMRFLQGLQ